MTKWIVVALTLLASSANAEEEWVHPDSTMQWKIRSEDYRDARVQFWSRNRPGQTWGPYSVPNIVGIFTLDCKQDEIVCFGAWSDQAKWNWGLGQDDMCQGNCKETQLIAPNGTLIVEVLARSAFPHRLPLHKIELDCGFSNVWA